MTENTPNEDEADQSAFADDLPHTVDFYRTPDPTLQGIAGFANRARAGMSFTFYTAAGVFSGDVISGEDFFEETAERQLAGLATNPDDEARELGTSYVELFFSDSAERYRDMREVDNSDEPVDDSVVTYIHLKDANVVTANRVNPIGHLRLRLADVTAWTPGKYLND